LVRRAATAEQEGRQVETLFHSWQTKPSEQGEGAPGLQGRLTEAGGAEQPGLAPLVFLQRESLATLALFFAFLG